VRNVVDEFNRCGPEALQAMSSCPSRAQANFDTLGLEGLRALLQDSHCHYSQPTVWTPDLLAEVNYLPGIDRRQANGETGQATVDRIGIGWSKDKIRVNSLDMAYRR
jgi:hypothetical protein